MSVNIVVACGSGAVTSTIVENRLHELADANNIQINTKRCAASALMANVSDVDLVVTSYLYKGEDLGVPILSATALVSGINEEKFENTFIETLKEINK